MASLAVPQFICSSTIICDQSEWSVKQVMSMSSCSYLSDTTVWRFSDSLKAMKKVILLLNQERLKIIRILFDSFQIIEAGELTSDSSMVHRKNSSFFKIPFRIEL